MGTTSYDINIEIFKGRNCDHHHIGQTFRYPEDIGNICPWLMDSINAMVRTLQFGGTLPWKYENSEFEKAMDPDDITTEFVRCPDPTDAGVVVKITRKKRKEPKKVGWS